MAGHLIVMSVDAMVFEDLEILKHCKNTARLLKNGALIERMHTIYPSLTHPVHVTCMTGCYPDKTGVYSNEHFVLGELNPPWYNSLSDVKTETIFHAAKKAGLTTAACRWPVTANGDDVIDYLVPEIMDADLDGDLQSVYARLGSGRIIEDIVKPNLSMLDGNKRPQYDAFEIKCAADIIKKYKPNLLFTHPGLVDHTRHETGLFNDQVTDALYTVDNWLGELFRAAEEAGIADDTDFVMMADHGHLSVCRVLCPNVFLAEEGLIRTSEDGSLFSRDAYIKTSGLSGMVYLRDPSDCALSARIEAFLRKLAADQIYGIGEVLNREEAATRYHLAGEFSFVVESDGYTAFCDDWRRPVVREQNPEDYRYGMSTHGHMPEKGPQPTFLAMGPDFIKGAVLEKGEIVNVAPTFAKVLGLTLPYADGKPFSELLQR